MKKALRSFPALLVLLIACNSQEKKTTEEPVAKENYFPVNDFILGEIKQIDSVPVGIMKKRITESKRDSAYIQLPEFHALSQTFINPELKTGIFEKNYTESTFGDETTGYFTFAYQPNTDKVNVTRVDVIVKSNGTSDKVQSIYIEKKYSSNDTAITEKLYWKSNVSFSIWKEKRAGADSASRTEKLEVIWDPASYQ